MPGGTKKNLEFYGKHVNWGADVEETDRLVLADAQTSGGLLIAVSRDSVASLEEALVGRGLKTIAVVGEILPVKERPRIEVVNA